MSPLEGTASHNPNIQGGSGFSAATVADLGFELTNGASHTTSGGKRPRTRPKAKTRGIGILGGASWTTQNVDFDLHPQPEATMNAVVAVPSAQHENQPTSQSSNWPTLNGPLGVSGSNDITGSGVSGRSNDMTGTGVFGGTQRRSDSRNDLVRSIMKEKNMTLPQASKHSSGTYLYNK